MAVRELRDFLRYGNISNSVNYPNCNMGPCEQAERIAIFHANKANMITQFTSLIGGSNTNIHAMSNQSRGEYAYTLMDLDTPSDESLISRICAIDGVYRVRVIR